jgi:hypothetical protein
MSRRSEPVKADDPKKFAGLTQRRREQGLPVGRIDRLCVSVTHDRIDCSHLPEGERCSSCRGDRG